MSNSYSVKDFHIRGQIADESLPTGIIKRFGLGEEYNQLFIQRIRVEQLFNQFTYEIDLETPGNVSVLIGPNGIGKTSVLNILSFLMFPRRKSFEQIYHIPFSAYEITLTNGLKFGLKKISEEDFSSDYLHPHDLKNCHFGKPGQWALRITRGKKTKDFILGNEKKTPQDKDCGNSNNETQRRIEYINAFTNQINRIYDEELRELDTGIFLVDPDVMYINSDRVGRIYEIDSDEMDTAPLYNRMCNILKQSVKTATNEYKRNIEAAKQTLLKRYISVGETPIYTLEEFEQGWAEYCNLLLQMIDIGFLEETDAAPDIGDLDVAYAQKGDFLCIYLETFTDALRPLYIEYEYWKLLTEIIDKRNKATGKRLKLTRDGVKMLINGQLISVDHLSSGEKNDLVLFFSLVATPNTLIIIDEPEISWHIVWQEEFLDQLLRICRARNLQAIVTTHSPNIINGHLELIAQRSEI